MRTHYGRRRVHTVHRTRVEYRTSLYVCVCHRKCVKTRKYRVLATKCNRQELARRVYYTNSEQIHAIIIFRQNVLLTLRRRERLNSYRSNLIAKFKDKIVFRQICCLNTQRVYLMESHIGWQVIWFLTNMISSNPSWNCTLASNTWIKIIQNVNYEQKG